MQRAAFRPSAHQLGGRVPPRRQRHLDRSIPACPSSRTPLGTLRCSAGGARPAPAEGEAGRVRQPGAAHPPALDRGRAAGAGLPAGCRPPPAPPRPGRSPPSAGRARQPPSRPSLPGQARRERRGSARLVPHRHPSSSSSPRPSPPSLSPSLPAASFSTTSTSRQRQGPGRRGCDGYQLEPEGEGREALPEPAPSPAGPPRPPSR